MSNNLEELGKLVSDTNSKIDALKESYRNAFTDASKSVELTIDEVASLKEGKIPGRARAAYLVTAEGNKNYMKSGPASYFIKGKNYNLSMLLFSFYKNKFSRSGSRNRENSSHYYIDNMMSLGKIPFKTVTMNEATKSLKIPESLFDALSINTHYYGNTPDEIITDEEMLKWVSESSYRDAFLNSIKIKGYEPYDFEATYINNGMLSIRDESIKSRVTKAFKKVGLKNHIIYRDEADLLVEDFNKYMPLIIKSCKDFDNYKGNINNLIDTYCVDDSNYQTIYRAYVEEDSEKQEIGEGRLFNIIRKPSKDQEYISDIISTIYDIKKANIEYFLDRDVNTKVVTAENTFEFYYGHSYRSSLLKPKLLRDVVPNKIKAPVAELDKELTYYFSRNANSCFLRKIDHPTKQLYSIEKDFKSNWYIEHDNYESWISKWMKFANVHPISNAGAVILYYPDRSNHTACISVKHAQLIVETNKPGEKYDYSKPFEEYPDLSDKYGFSKIEINATSNKD